MVTVISPAKSVDFETPACSSMVSHPAFGREAAQLIKKLRGYSPKRLMALMDISQNLADLNVERYVRWEEGEDVRTSKQAILAFDGDVYQGMEATSFTEADFEFAQGHLRILSGLYGILRPMDLIQPHRLEMGTQLKVGSKKNLYAYWESLVAAHLASALESSGNNWLLNLASQEYFGAVKLERINARLITPVFLDRKGADYKVVSFWAKKARGKMAAWVIANRLNSPESLQSVEIYGYRFNPALSDDQSWAFTRDSPQR